MSIDRLTPVFSPLGDVATIIRAIGVWFAVEHLRLTRQLAQFSFDADLAQEYRLILRESAILALISTATSDSRRLSIGGIREY